MDLMTDRTALPAGLSLPWKLEGEKITAYSRLQWFSDGSYVELGVFLQLRVGVEDKEFLEAEWPEGEQWVDLIARLLMVYTSLDDQEDYLVVQWTTRSDAIAAALLQQWATSNPPVDGVLLSSQVSTRVPVHFAIQVCAVVPPKGVRLPAGNFATIGAI